MRPNAFMLPRMDLQRTLLRECPVADSTLHKKKYICEIIVQNIIINEFLPENIYLKGLFSGMYSDMSHQLARFLKSLQTYGAFVHCFMFRSPLSLLHYLRLQLQRNKRDKTPEHRRDLFIKSVRALVRKKEQSEERSFYCNFILNEEKKIKRLTKHCLSNI